MNELAPLPFLGNYINGQFICSDRPDVEWVKKSPADLKDVVLEASAKHSHVDDAVMAAHRAFKEWSLVPLQQRIDTVLKIRKVFEDHSEQLATIIARETGKPLWETRMEVKSMLGKFDVTINHSLKLIEEQVVESALPGMTGYVRFRPRGVFAILGPFNFPGHLPNGHIVPALVTGNTVVFKPSEQTPATGQYMAELIHRAQLPPGVFNLVQGTGETGSLLVSHEKIDGILFTGSYEVGLKIKEKTLNQNWKILALEMGGKNASIVWEDADFNKAVYESLIGSFVSAGQRCSCTSRIILHKSLADKFIDKFYQSAKKLQIGHWKDPVFMGPVINEAAVEKYIRFQEIAVREGAEKIMRGKVLENLPHKGHYVTPSIYRVGEYKASSVYQNHEIFGPNVLIYTVDDLDEAIHINDAPGFGLVASIFSQNKKVYEHVLERAKVGLVNWNRTTNGASSRLPFGGMGKSGNDRPTAHYAVYYCTVPVASLEDDKPFSLEGQMPGMNFEPH